MLCCSVQARHHGDELAELDVSVAILVNLLDDGIDGLDTKSVLASEAENLTNLISRDHARVVLVEHLEGGVELLLGSQARLAGSSHDKLRVINEATVVGIHSLEHLLDLLVGHDSTVVLQVADLDLIHGEFTISVGVEGFEHLGKVVAFALVHELRGDEGESCLLQSDVRVELLQIVKSIDSQGLVDLQSGKFSEPWVRKNIFSRGSLVSAVGEQISDEAFGVLRNGLPDTVIERELTLTHLLHDVLIRLSVEGGHT